MSEWYHQKVEIVIRQDDDLYRRIEKYAQDHDTTVAAVIDTLISLGAYHTLKDRIEFLERHT
jgi:hypothetical protein